MQIMIRNLKYIIQICCLGNAVITRIFMVSKRSGGGGARDLGLGLGLWLGTSNTLLKYDVEEMQ